MLFAVAVVATLIRTRSRPTARPVGELTRYLRVIDAPVVAFRPRAEGYGLAEPARVWQAMAEVKGAVVSAHPRLQSGALIDEGVVLLRIDPTEYELAVAQRKASIAETQARLDELAAEERSKKASLEIEKRSVVFARQSLERLRTLRQQDAVAADEVDREERGALQQEQAVQQLENAIAQIPARREALTAALAVHEANLKQAEFDLAKTVIPAPFACRLGDVRIKEGQVVSANQQLFEAHGTDAVNYVHEIRADSREGLSITVVEMSEDGDFQTFFNDIERGIDAIDDFPDDVEEPVIAELGRTDLVMGVLVSGPLNVPDLKAYSEDLKDRMQESGLALIDIEGFSEHQLRVALSEPELRRTGLKVPMVAEAICRTKPRYAVGNHRNKGTGHPAAFR